MFLVAHSQYHTVPKKEPLQTLEITRYLEDLVPGPGVYSPTIL